MKYYVLYDVAPYEDGTIFGVFDENHVDEAIDKLNNSKRYSFNAGKIEVEINKIIEEENIL